MNIFSFFIFAFFIVFPTYVQSDDNTTGMIGDLPKITEALGVLAGGLQTHQCEIAGVNPKEDGVNGQCNFNNITEDQGCTADDIRIDNITNSVNSVLGYGVSEACECCKNPAQCAIKLPGGVEKFLEAGGIIGGLVGTIGGVSKICKDVKKLQMALAGLNTWAGIKCQRRGSICSDKHQTCDEHLGRVIGIIDRRIEHCDSIIKQCSSMCPGSGQLETPNHQTECQNSLITANSKTTKYQACNPYIQDCITPKNEAQNQAYTTVETCTPIKTTLKDHRNKLEELQRKLQVKGLSNCEFASTAGKTQVMQGAAFGAAAVVSHLCQKSTEGGEERQDPCLVEDSTEYNTPRCQCKRGEQPENVDCCVYDSLSPNCRNNNDPCVNDPSSTECICSRPEAQNHPLCRDNSRDIPLDEDSDFIEDPTGDIGDPDNIGDPDFQFLTSPGEKNTTFGGLPEIPPSPKTKSAFSQKTPKNSQREGGGAPSVGGGSLPSGGGPGGEGEGSEEEGESPYSNLLDGLSGKQNQGGAGGVGGLNSYDRKSGNPFDLKKFLPKGKNRKPSSKNKKAGNSSTLGESIFQRASRVTRVYCNKNQMECVPNAQ